MGSLQSELSTFVAGRVDRPRIYADANVPAGLVAFMRHRLGWDVLFVLEHPDLRRGRDGEHFRRAREMHRTLVSLDHDYFDDERFPPAESGGVIVMSAPDEAAMARLLGRIDRIVFGRRARRHRPVPDPAPLAGRKIHAHPGWPPPVKR